MRTRTTSFCRICFGATALTNILLWACPATSDAQVPAGVQCRVIDFEGFPAGTVLTNQVPGLSVAATPTKGPDALIIFDTANPTGGDFDLGTPNEVFGGPGKGPGIGNNRALSKVLILAEDVVDADQDGLIDDPDDDLDGGMFTLQFDYPVFLRKLSLVDFEEAGGTIVGTLTGSMNNASLFSYPIATPGDNSLQTLSFQDPVSVDRIDVFFPASGAIDEVEVCCDPAFDTDGDGVPNCLDLCDGVDDALLGESCDGNDADTCATGTYSCEMNTLVCSDNAEADDADADGTFDCDELCQGQNDALIGTACDGDDADSCAGGIFQCGPNNILVCTDDSAIEDTDGDGVSDCDDVCVGNDVLIGSACDGADSDECDNGVFTCAGGTLSCSDDATVDDQDGNGVDDCSTCAAACNPTTPDADSDGDGRSDCDEIAEGSDPCDSRSRVSSPGPVECLGANFFFDQVNIVTINNPSDNESLDVTVSYRDADGRLVDSVTYWLMPNGRQDSIVNHLGALPNTYGTVCVTAHTSRPNAWTGQLLVYKPRFDSAGKPLVDGLGEPVYDFALQYPFEPSTSGAALRSLNTNVLGSASYTANWVRLFDGKPGDGVGVEGVLVIYDIDGIEIGSFPVKLADGARADFAGHEVLGQAAVGSVGFEPVNSSIAFHFEVTRYFYESDGIGSNFVTAFTLPSSQPVSSSTRAYLSGKNHALSIIELVNGAADSTMAQLQLTGAGVQAQIESQLLFPRTSRHTIYGDLAAQTTQAQAVQLTAPQYGSLSVATLVYQFNAVGELLYGHAVSVLTPGGSIQRSEYNTFLHQENTVVLHNAAGVDRTVKVTAFDLGGHEISNFSVLLQPEEVVERVLTGLPQDTYGILLLSADGPGLVARTIVEREGQYAVSFPAR
ncbi:MAG: hypothetical protein KDD69_15950 [Bdellovibrionales bacterium]|nr:hypothetical protein [Bdellovibrionales bacterium]